MDRRFWLAIAALLPGIAGAQTTMQQIAGHYQMERDPSQMLVLRADGTGDMSGEALKWSVKENVLTITDESGTESSPYTLSGDRLVIVAGGVEVAFTRITPPKETVPIKKTQAKAAEKQQKEVAAKPEAKGSP